MFDYIQQHIKLVFAIGIVIVLALFGVLVYLDRSPKTAAPVTNSNASSNTESLLKDDSSKFLENNNLSKQDKYLMLLAQEMVEDYGTSQLGDPRPLQDLLNQSTSSFSPKVQSMINLISPTKNVTTSANGDSVKLVSSSDDQAVVSMDALSEDVKANTQTNISATVTLVKQGDYWLVNNIVFTNE
jgi:hypothetical protein